MHNSNAFFTTNSNSYASPQPSPSHWSPSSSRWRPTPTTTRKRTPLTSTRNSSPSPSPFSSTSTFRESDLNFTRNLSSSSKSGYLDTSSLSSSLLGDTSTTMPLPPRLFATPPKKKETRTSSSSSSSEDISPFTTTATTPSRLGSKDLSNLGYFAFPPPSPAPAPSSTGTGIGLASSHSKTNDPRIRITEEEAEDAEDATQPSAASASASAPAPPASASAPSPPSPTPTPPTPNPLHLAHLTRLSLEKTQATLNEEHWVSTGGILRDTNGTRDYTRTEKIKKELLLRDWEREVLRRWEEYERSWGVLLGLGKEKGKEKEKGLGGEGGGGGGGEIRFGDIPWPVRFESSSDLNERMKKDVHVRVSNPKLKAGAVPQPQVTLKNITTKGVQDFLTESLSVRGCTTTKKERIRSSLLRWHPDKLRGVVSRVVDDDRKEVEEGIGIVVRSLREMNSML